VGKVAIMVESIAHMPPELAQKYGIKIISMSIVIDGKMHKEVEVDLDKFYHDLLQIKDQDKLPTSSSVSTGEFVEAMRELAKTASGIVYVGHSIRLGMSVNAGMQAKKMVEEEMPGIRIEAIDSGTATGAQAFIALEAAKAAAEGKGFDEVVAIVKGMIPRVKYILLAENLEYLSGGGRIVDGKTWAEAKVKTKALLETDPAAGKVHAPLARFGTKTKAVAGLIDILKERWGDRKTHVIINHINVPDEAEALKEKVSSRFNCAELYVTPIYPVIGRHVGPGSLMVNWWCED